MKKFWLGVLILTSLTTFSQNIEIIGGVSRNNFFNYKTEGHFMSEYESAYGYLLQVSVDDINMDWHKWRLALTLEKYGGNLKVSDGGLGGGYSTTADVDKTILYLGWNPVNVKILKRIDFNLGIEFGRLIHETFSGRAYGWSMGTPDWSNDLSEEYDHFSANNYIGAKARIAYDIQITDKFVLSPQYSYYFGLTKEFQVFPEETKSMRHSFSVGLQRKLNRNKK